MADLDLLVPDRQVETAYDFIRELGYRPTEDAAVRPDHWSVHQHLPILFGAGKPLTIEVHRHIVRLDSPLAFNIDDFWDRSVPGHFDDIPVKVLSPEDTVLHLCINFFRDRRYYSTMALGQLCDIAEVARTYRSIDWRSLVEHTIEYRIGGPVASSLRLAELLLDAPIPSYVADELAPSMSERGLFSFAARRVVTMRQWQATELVAPGKSYGFLNTLGAIVRRIVPGPDYMRDRYGEASLRTYVQRLGAASGMLGRFIRHPSQWSEDLSVDKWLHGLYDGDDESAAILPSSPVVALEEAVSSQAAWGEQ